MSGDGTLAHSLSFSPDSSIITRILAGCTTGAMAVACAQPTDVVKVRFQANKHFGPDGTKKYSGTMDAYRTIAREEGLRGLWKGKSGLQSQGAFGRAFPTRGLGQRTERRGNSRHSVQDFSDSERASYLKYLLTYHSAPNSAPFADPPCAGY